MHILTLLLLRPLEVHAKEITYELSCSFISKTCPLVDV